MRVRKAFVRIVTVAAVVASATFAMSAMADGLFPGGDFTAARNDLSGVVFSNGGRVGLLQEEFTWNKCGFVEITAPTTNKDGVVTWNATALVGSSDGKTPGMAVEGGKTYDFSLELRGDSDGEIKAGVGAFAWDKGPWADGKNVNATVSRVLLQKTWTVVKGSFTVPEGKTRAAIRLQLWASSQYPPVKLKEGDRLYFDNIKVEESAYSLSALNDVGKAVPVEPRKAVAVGDTLRDFLAFERGRGAQTPIDAVAAKVAVDGDSLVITVSEKLPNGEARRGNAENVWSGDAAEVFFVPSSGKCAEKVVQFAWNAAGATFAKDAVGVFKIDGDSLRNGIWTSRVRIPFSSIGLDAAPEKGETMAFNVAVNGTGFCACWSPVKDGFGDAKRFGTLVFGTYGDSLKRRFGFDAVGADRAEYEKKVAEMESEALKKKFDRFGGKPFAVSVVPVDSDFACPFVPREAFDPVEAISLKGAVNEKVGLPVAILNLTDKAETYVVRIETDTADPEKPWAEKQMNGKWGLDGFPPERMTAREALRFKDTDNEPVTTRLEPLPKMNEACTIVVPPKEAGLAWFDFDCADVKPATYRGRLRVIPLSQAAKFDSWKGGFHTRMYSGQMQDVPVTLVVRPIVLDREPAQPFGFFQSPTTRGQFQLMADLGTRDFAVSPWSFKWAVGADGHMDASRPEDALTVEGEKVRKVLAWAEEWSIRPTFFVGFNAYPVFQGLYGAKGDAEKSHRLWPEYLRNLKEAMNKWGVADSDYAIEVWDEPNPEKFDEIRESLTIAKATVPDVRLVVTLGAHVMSAEDMRRLDPYIDGWILWRYGYFSRKEHLDYVSDALKRGKTVSHYTCDDSGRTPIYDTYRQHPWFGWRHSLSANHFFIFQEMMGGYGPLDFKKAASSGISYRSFDSTMPSLRYMSMRRGVEDLKYLAKLRKVAGDVPEVKAFLADAPIRVLEAERHVKSTADSMREKAAELILKYGAAPGPERDYFNDAEFRREYRDGAVEIARRKMASDEQKRVKSGVETPFKVRERLSTGGGFSGFFVWDSAFGVLWGRYVDGMPVHGTLDNLYELQQPDGFICREYDGSGRPMWKSDHPIAYNPPILAWAEIELFRSGKSDMVRLQTVYPKLVKFHECYDRNLKRPDGLYFSDILGCGMDDLKRWPQGMSREDLKRGGIEFTKANLHPWSERFWAGWMSKIVPEHTWNRQAAWIDMSAQMAFDCMNLADIAKAIGKNADVQRWMQEYRRIKDLVNEKCWDETTGYYYDCYDGGLIMRKHAGAFWTLLAKIPDQGRLERMVKTITDPRCFGRELGPPALSADDPDYNMILGYWQGPVWPPTTYALVCGLRSCGQTDVARKIAHDWYNANAELFVREKTVFENIPPDWEYVGTKRRHFDRDFCGWGALAPVALPAEWPVKAK